MPFSSGSIFPLSEGFEYAFGEFEKEYADEMAKAFEEKIESLIAKEV